MTQNALRQLVACGQSPWLDFVARSFIDHGDLQRLVDDGICGVTSNPTIFEKAISTSSDYDQTLEALVKQDAGTETIFQRLASSDIRDVADILRPVYDRSKAHDGYVSIEVSPDAAHDTAKTLEDAHILWSLVDRPNVMIKVPATPEGIPAIQRLIGEGINVNITLIFAVEVYEQVMDAYLRGLEQRVQRGERIEHIASVASFFVSRVDTLVDKLLGQRGQGADAGRQQEIKDLEGKAAIANAKIAYEHFEQVFGSERFRRLSAQGAQVQRPLWASTSTKNPNYPDTYYADALVGNETVDTMPLQTIDAVRDHGKIECGAVTRDVAAAHQVVERLRNVGINMTDVTGQLTREGVQSFADSLHQLYQGIERKAEAIKAGTVAGSAS